MCLIVRWYIKLAESINLLSENAKKLTEFTRFTTAVMIEIKRFSYRNAVLNVMFMYAYVRRRYTQNTPDRLAATPLVMDPDPDRNVTFDTGSTYLCPPTANTRYSV